MKAIVRLKPELIGTGKSEEGLQDLKGNHYTIKCVPGFIEVPVNIAKELEADPRVTVEYPGEEKPTVAPATKTTEKKKEEEPKEEMTKSEFTEEFIYSQNKAWQVDKIKELSANITTEKPDIPRREENRVKLILKLQKKR